MLLSDDNNNEIKIKFYIPYSEVKCRNSDLGHIYLLQLAHHLESLSLYISVNFNLDQDRVKIYIYFSPNLMEELSLFTWVKS